MTGPSAQTIIWHCIAMLPRQYISKFKIEIPTSGAYTLLRQNFTYMGGKEF